MASVCVIFNGAAGRGRATRDLQRLRRQCGLECEFRPTTHPGHGEELALEAAQSGFEVVAAAGGDGTVHEVANGILRAGRPEVIFHVLPAGSANDYAHTLLHEGTERQPFRVVDVGLARREDGRERYFVNCLGLGFNGMVTLEARRIPWLWGVPLYGLALLRALVHHFRCPTMRVTLDEQTRVTPTLALSIDLGRREGNFVLAPNARLDDGWFDYLHGGDLKRRELLRYLPQMVTGNLPTDYPKLWMGRCQRASVQSPETLTVHLDGEFFCQAADGVRQLEVNLLPAALRVATGALKSRTANQPKPGPLGAGSTPT